MIFSIEITDIPGLDFDRLFTEMWAIDSAPENLEMKTFVDTDYSIKEIREKLHKEKEEFGDEDDDDDEIYDEDNWESETLRTECAIFFRKGQSTSGIRVIVNTDVFYNLSTYELQTVTPGSNKVKRVKKYNVLIPDIASKEDLKILNLVLRAVASINPMCAYSCHYISEPEDIASPSTNQPSDFQLDIEKDFELKCMCTFFEITRFLLCEHRYGLFGEIGLSHLDIDFSAPTFTKKMEKVWERLRFVTWTDRTKLYIPEPRFIIQPEFTNQICARDFFNTADTLIQPCEFIAVHCDGMVKYSISSQVTAALRKIGTEPEGDDLYFIIPKMETEKLREFYRTLEGIEAAEIRRVFLLRWNPTISDFKLERLRELLKATAGNGSGIGMRWAIRDHDRVRVGDIAFLAVVGTDYNGIAMGGYINKMPEKDTDWAGSDRVQYYVRFSPTMIVDPTSEIGPLSAEILKKELPDIDWNKGHSGIELTANDGNTLIGLWEQYRSVLKAKYRVNTPEVGFYCSDEPDDTISDED